MDRLADFRDVFARVVMSRAGCEDPPLRRAFSAVPRHEFVGPAPWVFSEDGVPAAGDDPALLYQDVALALDPARGITTGLPSLHARCLSRCRIEPGETVLHVGAGTGYFTAILAELVGDTGSVTGFERDPPLAAAAARHLERWPQVRIEPTSGVSAVAGPADLVYVSAGVEQLPRAWLDALAPAGRLLFPLTPGAQEGGLFLVRRLRTRAAFHAELVSRARFIPCAGTADEEARARLTAAFAEGGQEAVRSLRLHPDAPDETAWFSGRGWWLSTRPAVE